MKIIFIGVQMGTYFGEDDIVVRKTIRRENNEKKAIIVSGYFNPIHVGHIEYFKAARNMQNSFLLL